MVLCTLINISVDLSASISWWILKNALCGTYNMGYYLMMKNRPRVPTQEQILIIELRNQVSELNTTIHRQLDIINEDDDFIIINKEDF